MGEKGENMWGREDNLVHHIGRNRDPQNSSVMITTYPYDEVKRGNWYKKWEGMQQNLSSTK